MTCHVCVEASARWATHFAPIGVAPEVPGRYTCALYRMLSDKGVFQHVTPEAWSVTVCRTLPVASSSTTVALSDVRFATRLIRLSAPEGSSTDAMDTRERD